MVPAPIRWVCCEYMSNLVGGAAETGMPDAARCRSARMSAAVWYRSAGDLAIAFSTIASAHAGTSGSTRDGGIGFSLTCW